MRMGGLQRVGEGCPPSGRVVSCLLGRGVLVKKWLKIVCVNLEKAIEIFSWVTPFPTRGGPPPHAWGSPLPRAILAVFRAFRVYVCCFPAFWILVSIFGGPPLPTIVKKRGSAR